MMDFAATLTFLVLYYIRPQEWIPGVGLLRPVTLVMVWALGATWYRKAGLSRKDLFRTPHDTLMALYFLWITVTAHNPIEAGLGVYNLYAFYVVTVLALSDLGRLGRYLNWWTGLVVTIGAFGVASTLGFDPMGSREVTEGVMEGRLALGTLIFNNANALGHSVVPALLMLYVLLGWQRPLWMAAVGISLAAIPAYCVYLTFSKGAYLSGFFTAIVSLCFRRPWVVQAGVVVSALTLGLAGLQQLPRMSTMGNTKADEGIQRRSAAFRFGYDAMRANLTGLGYNRFVPKIEARGGRLVAGPHSSFVRVGGEFGVPGLFLFCGILFSSYRTLYAARTLRVEEERAQRLLLVLLVSFTISSWAIDWSLSAYFVLQVAAIASFHRGLLAREASVGASSGVKASGVPMASDAVTPDGVSGGGATSGSGSDLPVRRASWRRAGRRWRPGNASGVRVDAGVLWNQVRWVDLGFFGALTFLVMFIWRHAMNAV